MGLNGHKGLQSMIEKMDSRLHGNDGLDDLSL